MVWPHKVEPPENNNQFALEAFQREQAEAKTYPKYSVPFYPQWWRWKRIR